MVAATLQNLPIEIHQLIINWCYQLSYDTLVKLALLNRYFHSLVQPVLTTSTDLVRLNCDEQKLQLYIHHFAPLHRTRLIHLSLVLSRSQIPNPYSLDDGLDEIYANIFSLLPRLKTLRLLICSGSTKDDLDKEDFEMTRNAIGRLERLEHVSISGDQNLCSAIISQDAPPNSQFISRVIFETIPQCKLLRKLTITSLVVLLPSDLSKQSNQLRQLAHLELDSVQLLRLTFASPQSDLFCQFINFFSETLESLIIRDVKLDLPLQPHAVEVPKLYKLVLSISKLSSDFYFPNDQLGSIRHHHLELLYRDLLEYFASSSLQSIDLPEPIGLAQFKALCDRGTFRNVYEINS